MGSAPRLQWFCLAARLSALALLSATACNVYDASVLEPKTVCGDGKRGVGELCDTMIAQGQPGACPERCGSDDPCAPTYLAGSGCQTRCIAVPVTEARAGDGCCPEGASAAEDSDCGDCGDSIIQGVETCDPPSSCPTHCDSPAKCAKTKLVGSADKCSAKCQYELILTCADDDGCCAQGCTVKTDNDCNTSCGDGRVDAKIGETCEPGSQSAPCPASCDDGDPCTEDLSTGSSEACNKRCLHTPITSALGGDHCCPPGANAGTDSDCAPQCGNGQVEGSEQCDGGGLCAPDCSWAHGLRHRYSFEGTGSSVVDSVGSAHGVIANATLSGHGDVELAGGTSDQFVNLPAGIIHALSSATIEVWFTWRGGAIYQRVFDFGNNDNGQGNQGTKATSYWGLMTSCSQGNLCCRMNFTPALADNAADFSLDNSQSVPVDAISHIAFAFDAAADRYRLYFNGALVGTREGVTGELSQIDDSNVWIGRSNFNDPELGGTVTEVRIYDQALSDAQVAASYQAGPDP